jgi:SAM-dependent methyltransferase
MDSPQKEYLISFYDRNLKLYGDRPEALRWTPGGQRARYGLMLEIAESLDGKKILDYGCGKGDFYAFLKARGIRVDYTGMDINPRLIELAASKYPDCAFRVFDIEEEDFNDEAFDYVFLCGVFNNRVEGATETMMKVVSTLFKHTKVGLALNAISSHSPKRDVEINYVRPEDTLGFALKYLTPHVILRHDRVPHDFTMFLYKNPTKNGRPEGA